MIINGEYQSQDLAQDYWLDAGGVFETIRTYENRPFALERHLKRLEIGMKALEILPPNPLVLEKSLFHLLEHETFPNGRLRIVVAGDGAWTISHHEYRPNGGMLNCRTFVSSQMIYGAPSIFKRTDYRGRLEIQQESVLQNYDDAILVSNQGEVIEGTVCNLIIEIDGVWHTPVLSSGCLAGITRGLLIENFGVQERYITTADLERAQSAAFISSLREIQGIQAIDGELLPDSGSLVRFQEIFHSWILGNLLP